MSSTEIPVINPLIVLREESDNWAFLYNPDTGVSFGINPTGVMTWKLIDGKRTIAEIAEECAQRSTNVPLDIEMQIAEFVKSLVAQKLLEIFA